MYKYIAPSIALTLALSTATFAVGCNSYPTGSAPTPRSVVLLNSLQIPTDAPLAVSLDVRPLLQGLRSVQQVASSPTVGPVSSLEVQVSGGNLTSPVTQSIRIADCASSGLASFLFYLPAGSYKVLVNALDAAGQRVSHAVAEGVQVADNHQTVVPITCTPTTGSILIKWTCTTNCGPAPMPSPLTPPSTLLPAVTDIEVDNQGRLYLGGPDPVPDAQFAGRMIRVLPNLTLESDTQPFYDNMTITNDMEIVGDKIYTNAVVEADPYRGGAHEVGLTAFPGTKSQEWIGRYFTAFGARQTGDVIGCVMVPELRFYSFASRANPYTSKGSYIEINQWSKYSSFADYKANGMVFDKDDQLIWVGKAGICTTEPGMNKPLTILAPLPATAPTSYLGGLSIELAAPGSTKFLVTYDGDPSVYLWDKSSSAAPRPLDVDLGSLHPRKVELGPDGSIYLLLGDMSATGYVRGILNKYRVTKYSFDSATDKLVEQQVMVEVK